MSLPSLPVHRNKIVPVTIRDLKRLRDWNPSHPVCNAFDRPIADFPDEAEVLIGRESLLAVLTNRELVVRKKTVKTNEGPELVHRQCLGKTYQGTPQPVGPCPMIAGVNAPEDYVEEDEDDAGST